MRGSGTTLTTWMREQPIRTLPELERDERADVCVVGAGISGLTLAYLLALEGQKVIVLDRRGVGGGETSRTTAHLASALDDRFYLLEKEHGREKTRLAAESHRAAINEIERICQAENLACAFERVPGFLFSPPGNSGSEIEQELQAAKRAGEQVQLLTRAPLKDFDTGVALRFESQGQFEPMRYLNGVADAFQHLGGRILQAAVVDVENDRPAVVVTASGRRVLADFAAVCTNTPVMDRFKMHTKQSAYRTYALSLRVQRDSIPRGLYWDTLDPYHYVRWHGEDVLIVGGEDHKTGQGDDKDRFKALEVWTRDRFAGSAEVLDCWSGQVMEPADSLAFIGRNPGSENVFIATGDSGHGMTHGTIAGMLIRDLILGRKNAWEDVYDPSRKPTSSIIEFVKENLNVGAQYADFVTPAQVESVADIQPGSGAVLRRNGEKLAVYRKPEGGVCEMSAICPHLGCVVNWNRVEQSWDCPCHGSRFTAQGEVLNGPSATSLETRRTTEGAAKA